MELSPLMALNILKNFEFESDGRESAETRHRRLEAMKLAFADGTRYVADPKSMTVTAAELLSWRLWTNAKRSHWQDCRNAKRRRSEKRRHHLSLHGRPGREYGFPLSRAILTDSAPTSSCRGREYPFRTGVCLHSGWKIRELPGTGKESVSYDNSGFPDKRRGGGRTFWRHGSIHVPQGHVQVLMNMIDFKLNPQEALDAPRWQWIKDKKVQVEPLFPKELAKLSARGHEVEAVESAVSFGRGEMILKDKTAFTAVRLSRGQAAMWRLGKSETYAMI